MNHLDVSTLLLSFVGKTYLADNREVKVLSLLTGPVESFYVCIWLDTCMVFSETPYQVGKAMAYDILTYK